jgi:hypothetical protein
METMRPIWDAKEPPAYRVKPLQWVQDNGASIWKAETIFGRFVYGTDNDGLHCFQTPNGGADRKTLDEARDAAQRSYETFVKVHLEPIKETKGP